MMNEITSFRESVAPLPYRECGRVLAAVLTSDEWSGERAHLVGRTGMHFVVAVRGIDAANDAVRFRVIADSPDLRHPVAGRVELRPKTASSTALSVMLRADLDSEPPRDHLLIREAIASLSEVLGRTILDVAHVPADEGRYAGVAS
jgi:hypothetical protein